MEKQRCPSIKTTRFLLFAFTISSSVVFLIFFSLWLTSAASSVHQETHFVFNSPTLTLGLKPLTVQTSTVSTRNFSGILIGTQLTRPGNRSGFANVPGFETKESGAEVSGDGEIANFAINGTSIAIGTLFGKSENSSGFAQGSVTGLLQRRGIESKGVSDNEIYKGASINGKLTSAQYSVFDNLPEKKQVSSGEVVEEHKIRDCDVTKGRWIFEENYPLYTNVSCPFIDEGFDCQGNGRLDKEYMKWRWKPQDCDIPRFNATNMLELIRGKRLVYVGDSINRNQWESMLCLLMGAIKDPKRVYETRGRRITKEKGDYSFKFVDYKCTVEYYLTHFLVHESKARLGKKRVQTLKIDTMDKGSSRWRGADILVFNTAHWWTHFKTKAGINYYQERGQIYPHLDVSTALQRALLTWASWVDKHTNPGKTRVFFRSSSPSHFRGGQWNSGGHCKEATEPLPEISSFNYPDKNAIVKDVIKHMKTPVTFLNVTNLSAYRIDAHPSVYGRKFGKSYSSSFQDCSHWCLPGVPDTWNELLYHHLHFERREML